MTKYIFITGGVISGLGKGITSASVGAILKEMGYNITIKKLDPYFNINTGTMNPLEHGEVFVTNDGLETDLDLGHYERIVGIETTRKNSTSSGNLMVSFLKLQQTDKYLGQTIQLIPHFTNHIIDFIKQDEEKYDFIIVEVGGNISDIEAMTFFEAIRQFRIQYGRENILLVFLTYILYYVPTKELKTKPTQDAVKKMMQAGLQPDILICRTEHSLNESIRNKLELYTNVTKKNIIEAKTQKSIYQVPLKFQREGLGLRIRICEYFRIDLKQPLFGKWDKLNNKIINTTTIVKVGLIGKYTQLSDSYFSLIEALKHAGWEHNKKIKIIFIDARNDEERFEEKIDESDVIVIAGGFGNTGIENMIRCITYCRLQKKRTLGICLGMQLMFIEYCRNFLKLKNANSTEFSKEGDNIVVNFMSEWLNKDGDIEQRNKGGNKCGTMRLGSHEVQIEKDTLAHSIYNKEIIHERHRHRYELNINLKSILECFGVIISGISSSTKLPEIIELEFLPFFIGCQYHPEYQSSPFKCNPIFYELLN